MIPTKYFEKATRHVAVLNAIKCITINTRCVYDDSLNSQSSSYWLWECISMMALADGLAELSTLANTLLLLITLCKVLQ